MRRRVLIEASGSNFPHPPAPLDLAMPTADDAT
jgi:hypothetical protein